MDSSQKSEADVCCRSGAFAIKEEECVWKHGLAAAQIMLTCSQAFLGSLGIVCCCMGEIAARATLCSRVAGSGFWHRLGDAGLGRKAEPPPAHIWLLQVELQTASNLPPALGKPSITGYMAALLSSRALLLLQQVNEVRCYGGGATAVQACLPRCSR